MQVGGVWGVSRFFGYLPPLPQFYPTLNQPHLADKRLCLVPSHICPTHNSRFLPENNLSAPNSKTISVNENVYPRRR